MYHQYSIVDSELNGRTTCRIPVALDGSEAYSCNHTCIHDKFDSVNKFDLCWYQVHFVLIKKKTSNLKIKQKKGSI